MPTHIVEPGDWLGSIASRYGISQWSLIWNHPENTALRERRGSPDLIMAGDALAIPQDTVGDAVEVPAGSRAVFVVRAATDVLRVRLRGVQRFIADFGPMPYVLRAGDESAEGEIESEDQIIEVPLPIRSRPRSFASSSNRGCL